MKLAILPNYSVEQQSTGTAVLHHEDVWWRGDIDRGFFTLALDGGE